MMPKLSIILLVFFLLTGCTPYRSQSSEGNEQNQTAPAAQSEPTTSSSDPYEDVQVIGGDERALREFIERWFAPQRLYSDEGGIILRMGEFPEDMPEQFILPDDAKIVASIQRPHEIQVFLDIPEDTLDFYIQKLDKADWMPVEDEAQGSGFVSYTSNWLLLCHEELETALSIQEFPRVNQVTEIQLSFYTGDTKSMCEPQGGYEIDQAYQMLPTLKTPIGSLVFSGGASSGDGTAESSSEINTDLSPQELSDHFSGQLQDSGWSYQDGGDTESFSWSSWTTQSDQSEQWYGTLIVLESPVEGARMYALMRVVQASE